MAGSHPLVRGALVGRHALAFQLIGSRDGPAAGGPGLPRLPLIFGALSSAAPAVLRVGLAGGPPELFDAIGLDRWWGWPTRTPSAPLRWHATDRVLYYVSYGLEVARLPPGGGVESPNGHVCRLPLTARLLAACRLGGAGAEGRDWLNAKYAVLHEVGATSGLTNFSPVDTRFGRFGADRRPEPELWRTHFDFHTADGQAFELFVAAPGGLDAYHAPPGRGARMPQWGLRSSHPPAWVGPFYVVADGDDRHFVVPGGRMFTLPADAKPGSALVKTWDAGPVLALVQDADAAKSYAFTKSHYFHVTAKPDPKPHGLAAFPGATAEEALDTVAKCGRVIRGLR